MKFSKKTKISSEIPTASMPDIIFMLLVFFMVTTVLKEYSGLPVNLPKAKRIEKLKSKTSSSSWPFEFGHSILPGKSGMQSMGTMIFASGTLHLEFFYAPTRNKRNKYAFLNKCKSDVFGKGA